MRKVKWHVYTGYVGADYFGEFEVEDCIDDDEIEELVEAEVFDRISFDWEVIEE
jgi:hypothetical protein